MTETQSLKIICRYLGIMSREKIWIEDKREGDEMIRDVKKREGRKEEEEEELALRMGRWGKMVWKNNVPKLQLINMYISKTYIIR